MRVHKSLCLTLWDALNTRLGPLQWDIVASSAGAQSLTEGGLGRTPQGLVSFSQTLTVESGLYANTVFGMILQFLNLVRDQKAQVALLPLGGTDQFPGERGGGSGLSSPLTASCQLREGP
jgi:hypothetical protein